MSDVKYISVDLWQLMWCRYKSHKEAATFGKNPVAYLGTELIYCTTVTFTAHR